MIAFDEKKAIAFTGHRILEDDERDIFLVTKSCVERYIESGFDTFFCGMATGFDLLSGELVVELKKSNAKLKLVACLPYDGCEKSYSSCDKASFRKILDAADEVVTLSKRYYNGCFHFRDKFMADNASVVIAYQVREKSGTGFTTSYAALSGKQILNVKTLIENEKTLD